jgi:para-nitrobenzyl esterase
MGARFQTDRDFRCPVLQVATWHASHGFPTFVYQFDRSADSDKPAQHSSELRFVFGYFPSHKESSADDSVANVLQSYWAAFARTGKPEAPGLPHWRRFSATSGDYLHFSSTATTPIAATGLGGAPCTILTDTALPMSN